MFSVSQWMVFQLESSKTWNQRVSLTLRTSQWEFTQAFGMLMIGPQGVVWSRQIGVRLLSLPPMGTSKPRLVFGPLVHLLVVPIPYRLIHGSTKSWILLVKKIWNGYKKITWFITTVPMLRGFPKAFHQSAVWHKVDRTTRNVLISFLPIATRFVNLILI